MICQLLKSNRVCASVACLAFGLCLFCWFFYVFSSFVLYESSVHFLFLMCVFFVCYCRHLIEFSFLFGNQSLVLWFVNVPYRIECVCEYRMCIFWLVFDVFLSWYYVDCSFYFPFSFTLSQTCVFFFSLGFFCFGFASYGILNETLSNQSLVVWFVSYQSFYSAINHFMHCVFVSTHVWYCGITWVILDVCLSF